MSGEAPPARAARILAGHGLSMPDHYLLGTAGHRINAGRARFLDQTAWEFAIFDWPVFSREELDAALTRLIEAGLLTILTESDLERERRRRAASAVPEVDDANGYQPGHVDFTERGYLLNREVTRELHGDEFVRRNDLGVNLDPDARRFDILTFDAKDCARQMDAIQAAGDANTGAEGTVFVAREGPVTIGAWRPNRFIQYSTGHHGILRYVTGD